jgi:hypothetical protein
MMMMMMMMIIIIIIIIIINILFFNSNATYNGRSQTIFGKNNSCYALKICDVIIRHNYASRNGNENNNYYYYYYYYYY